MLTLILVSILPPCSQQHVKDPSHSAKIAGGRLQLNIYMHPMHVALHEGCDMLHSCTVYTEWAEMAAVSPAM